MSITNPWFGKLCACLLLCAGTVAANGRDNLSFEVVSIRPVAPDAPRLVRPMDYKSILPGGRYIDSRVSLLEMIAIGYDIPNPQKFVSGLPKWARETMFSVWAQPPAGFPELPPNENSTAVRQMLRSMLTKRFRLRLQKQIRVGRVFNLELAKGGLRVSEVDPPIPPAQAGLVGAAMSDTSGRIIGTRSTMEGLAAALSIFFEYPVVNNTGLGGHYDIDIRWREDPPENSSRAGGFGSDGLALLISNLRSQLGLQLKSAKARQEYWVVEEVSMPVGP